MPTSGLWKLRLNSDARIYSPDFEGFFSRDVEALGNPKDGMQARASVAIGPYSMLVFSQET